MSVPAYAPGDLDEPPIDVERLDSRLGGLQQVNCYDESGRIDLNVQMDTFTHLAQNTVPTGYAIDSVSVHPEHDHVEITLAPTEENDAE